MKEVKINLEKLSKEEREQLMKLVEKANKPTAGRLKPAKNDIYFYMSYDPEAIRSSLWAGDTFDNARFSLGNVFKTREEAKFALEKRKVEVELQDVADELNDGWKPDWKNNKDYKYFMYYDCRTRKLIVGCNTACNHANVHFKDEPCAKEAIKRIGEERLKKYYFEVE